MSLAKCRVKSDWFLKVDALGNLISLWCTKSADGNLSAVFCKICCQTINCEKKGFQAIVQHVDYRKHLENAKNMLSATQLRLTGGTEATTSVQLYCTKDSGARAELIWSMKNVVCNMSAESCDGISKTFEAMFTEAFPKGFSLGSTKLSYIISEALGPYFRQQMLNEMKDVSYTLQYDETTNAEEKKELQIVIRYWSEHQVVTRHLKTFFMSKAASEDLRENIYKAMDNANLSREGLLMLVSDGPNVNKKVWRLMNDDFLVHH